MAYKDPEKRREYQKRYMITYRAKHRERLREKAKEYRAKHREEMREYQSKYYAERRDERLADVKKYYAEHREERLAYAKEYSKTEKCKASMKKYKKKYAKHNPEKKKAQYTLNNAIRSGQIKRPSECSACGKECKPHGHHWDYSQPLDVRWLCAACHEELHALCKEFKSYYHRREHGSK